MLGKAFIWANVGAVVIQGTHRVNLKDLLLALPIVVCIAIIGHGLRQCEWPEKLSPFTRRQMIPSFKMRSPNLF